MKKTEALPSKSLQSTGRIDPFINNSNRMWSVPTGRSGRAPMGAEQLPLLGMQEEVVRHEGLMVRKVLCELESSVQTFIITSLGPEQK